jgi:hypothetical protein
VETAAWGELGDQRLSEVVELDQSATVGDAIEQADGRWIVIAGPDGTALSAVDPATLGQYAVENPIGTVLADLPPVVTAAAETPVGYLLQSWMADELEPGSAFIAVSDDGVAGVWAGPEMLRAVAFAANRGVWDPDLPGEIKIPLLTRNCRYSEGGVACTSVAQFAEPPDPAPPCDNPIPLTAHRFEW